MSVISSIYGHAIVDEIARENLVETKTGLYCLRSYIGSSGYTNSDKKRCQTTNFIPASTISASCTDEYLIYLAAYNEDGTFAGYYTTAGELGTSPIDKQTSFDIKSIMSAIPGYRWRITIQTTSGTDDISSGVYPITISYQKDSEVQQKYSISHFCTLAQGGYSRIGTTYTSNKYVTSSVVIGLDKLILAPGYLVTIMLWKFTSEVQKTIYIYRKGRETPISDPLDYGYEGIIDLAEIQNMYPDYVIRLIFSKIGGADITVAEAEAACMVTVDATAFEAEAIIERYRGRKRLYSNGYATENLDFYHTLATISADRQQEDLFNIPNNGVSAYGKLYVDSTTNKLTSSITSAPVQLKGVCCWNIADGSQTETIYGLRTMRRRGANLVRVVCFPTTNAGRGYLEVSNKRAYIDTLKQLIYDCIALDMYVVIDWHLLHEADPTTYSTEASEFFDEMSSEFIGSPNILYEICNEPHSNWDDIKTYANIVIPVIRANTSDAVCIVGTPNYSCNLSAPLADPLSITNIMYTYHWYSNYDYETQLSPYVSSLPIFVTEWGAKNTGNHSGGSGTRRSYNIPKAQSFLSLLEANGISWEAWSLWQGDDWNESTFLVDPYQNDKCMCYGGWPYYLYNPFGKLVVDNFDHVAASD